MKTLPSKLLFFILIFVVTGISAQTAGQYMEVITKEFKKISEETWDYTRAVAHGKKARQIENRRRDMINANRNGLTKIKNMQPFNGDPSYRDSVVKYLDLSYAVLNNDYSKIVDMEEISEQSYDAMEAYMTAQQIANDRLEAAFDIAYNAQLAFAAKNNIRLESKDDKTNQKLEKASEIFKYYNTIYLIFFKPYKQEAYFLVAQAKGDINGMKQNQESLSKLSKEAKDKLKSTEPYKGNSSLKDAGNEMLDFYIYEADKKITPLIDFYLKKEKFEKLKTAMDKKGKSASQSEVDEFNKAVNDYNTAANDVNAINNELNNKRASVLDNWNNSISKFLDKNVSKKK